MKKNDLVKSVLQQEMDDPVDLAMGILTGGSLVVCGLCIAGYFIREARRMRLKPSRSETKLVDIETGEPEVQF